MKLVGHKFTNSNTCHGVSFAAEGALLDMAEITINGRYPETGWAQNLESHEMVRVLRGSGRLLYRDGQKIEISQGDTLHVPPATWFAWDGDVTILMTCSPAFNPDQYEIKGGE